eukprot:55652-Ditylum_brightwellii.AAC.1
MAGLAAKVWSSQPQAKRDSGRLIALDKCPGICPVAVGKILLRMMDKCIISACGENATELEHGEEENWVILLVDTKNTFNQINRKVMLWE